MRCLRWYKITDSFLRVVEAVWLVGARSGPKYSARVESEYWTCFGFEAMLGPCWWHVATHNLYGAAWMLLTWNSCDCGVPTTGQCFVLHTINAIIPRSCSWVVLPRELCWRCGIGQVIDHFLSDGCDEKSQETYKGLYSLNRRQPMACR